MIGLLYTLWKRIFHRLWKACGKFPASLWKTCGKLPKTCGKPVENGARGPERRSALQPATTTTTTMIRNHLIFSSNWSRQRGPP